MEVYVLLMPDGIAEGVAEVRVYSNRDEALDEFHRLTARHWFADLHTVTVDRHRPWTHEMEDTR
jgi:hypothetical protein